MPRRLSSSLTVIYKFAFPSIFLGTLGTAAVSCLLDARGRTPCADCWGLIGGFVIAALFLYWLLMRLKGVRLDGDTLILSNYAREIRVPLKEVRRVSGSFLMNPEVIWLHFRHETEFGTSILFLPRMRWWRGFSRHPMVSELEDLVDQAASTGVER